MLRYLFAAFFAISVSAYAENRAIVFGGVDDPRHGPDRPEEYNQFLEGITSLVGGLRESGWRVNPLFDGDEASCRWSSKDRRCEDARGYALTGASRPLQCCPGTEVLRWNAGPIATAAGRAPGTPLGRATREQLLRELRQARDELHPGDRLFLVISTHGGNGVFCAGGPRGSATQHCELIRYDDPEIQTLLGEIRSRGIEMAFEVDACHSGSAIEALSAHGCVVATAAADELGYTTSILSAVESTRDEGGIAFTRSGTRSVMYNDDDSVGDLIRGRGYGGRRRAVTMDELFIFQLQRRIEECRRGPTAVQSSPQMSGYPRARGSDVPAGTLVSADRCELPPDALPVRPGVIAEYLRFFEELAERSGGARTASIPPWNPARDGANLTSARGEYDAAEGRLNDWDERYRERSFTLRIPLASLSEGGRRLLLEEGGVFQDWRPTLSPEGTLVLEPYVDTVCTAVARGGRGVVRAAALDLVGNAFVSLIQRGAISNSEAEALQAGAAEALQRAMEAELGRNPEICPWAIQADLRSVVSLQREIEHLEGLERCAEHPRRLRDFLAYRERLLTTSVTELSSDERRDALRLRRCADFRLAPPAP